MPMNIRAWEHPLYIWRHAACSDWQMNYPPGAAVQVYTCSGDPHVRDYRRAGGTQGDGFGVETGRLWTSVL